MDAVDLFWLCRWRPSIPLSSASGELEHEDIDNPLNRCTVEEEEEGDVGILTG